LSRHTSADGCVHCWSVSRAAHHNAPGGWSVGFKDPDGHPLAFFQEEALPRRR